MRKRGNKTGLCLHKLMSYFSKGKKPVEVAIMLNIGEGQVTEYYTEYLRLIQLDDVTQIYRELKGDVWYFVNLCKAAKSGQFYSGAKAKMLAKLK